MVKQVLALILPPIWFGALCVAPHHGSKMSILAPLGYHGVYLGHQAMGISFPGPSTWPGLAGLVSTAIRFHLLHSHRLRSRPDQIQNPKSKLQTGRLDFGFWILEFGVWILEFGFWSLEFGFWIWDFGFWILDLGFWILEFGFWILDQFSLRSFCGGPKRRRLDFGVWILDFGFGLGLPNIVWILHKIFPCHADSGRRILEITVDTLEIALAF